MAAPSYATSGAYLEGDGSTASFAVPAGVAFGDIIVVSMFVNFTASITAMPSGFAHAEGSPVVAGTNHSLVVVWKRATGADSGTYDFTLSASAFRAGAAHRYTGAVAAGAPFDSPSDAAADGATNGSVTPAVDVTTAGPDRLLLFAGTNWAGGSWTPPTGFTERQDNGFGHVTLAEKVQAAAGGSGSVTATCTGSDRRAAWLGALIGTTSSGAATVKATSSASVAGRTSTPVLSARYTSTPEVTRG